MAGTAIATGLLVVDAGLAFASDEIIVTARRRDENLQDVPVSAAVITPDFAETFQLDGPRDYLDQIPGARNSVTLGTELGDDIVIRGVGVARNDVSASATGIYRNGVFIGNGSFFGKTFTRFDTFDMERFEVFRGPQGALWGRNAAGGAINIVSARPKFEHEGRVSFTYEVEQEQKQIEVVENFPINDWLAIRVGAQWDDRDGGLTYIDDPTSPRDGHNLDEALFAGARVGLRARPIEDLDIVLTYEWSEARNTGYAATFYKAVRDPGKLIRTCEGSVPGSGQHCILNEDSEYKITTHNAFLNTSLETGIGTVHLDALWTERDGKAVDDLDAYLYPNTGFWITPDISNPRYGQFQKYGVELRLSSNDRSPTPEWMTWLIGADYQDSKDTFFLTFELPDVMTMGATILYADRLAVSRIASSSVFASVGFDITDRLNVAAEFRATENRLDTLSDDGDRTFTPGVGFTMVVPNPHVIDIAESRFTPAGTVTYQVAPGHKVYGRVATGFRPAGFDPRFVMGSYFPPYLAEDIRSHEIGYKGQAYDGRIQFDLAVFYVDHRNIQITDRFLNDTGTVVSRIGNGGDAWSAGLELGVRGNFDVGPGMLKVNGGYGYQNGRIYDGSYSGNRIPETRDYQITLSSTYSQPVFNSGWTGSANLAFTAEGGGWQRPDNDPELANYERFDGSLSLSDDRLKFQLFARNIFDELYITYNAFAGVPIIGYNQPRTWGASVAYKW
ncbi:MAG: TonB-dependent receptor [Alphaproteobacteria bacterium]|nr:TonB-dependent receptor [Alphaproteobacteria bacterium]